jgi:hypothetical protein
MVSLDGVCPGSVVASVSGLISICHLDCPGFEGCYHIVQFLVHCALASAMGNDSVVCAGTGLAALGIAGRLTTSGICGSRTPAGIE